MLSDALQRTHAEMFLNGDEAPFEREVDGLKGMRVMKKLLTVSVRILCILQCLVSAGNTYAQATTPTNVVSLEGPITAINPTARTITVSGMVCSVPPDLILGGTRGISGATMSRLLDAQAPSKVRSIFQSGPLEISSPYSGATLKADGIAVLTGTVESYVLTAAIVELAENLVVGTMQNFNAATRSFTVNGITCRMNTDERFPADIVSLLATPLTFGDLARGNGKAVSALGYIHQGVFHVCTIETELLPTTPGADTVVITRADGRARGVALGELRVDGIVEPLAADTLLTLKDTTTGAILGTVAPTVVPTAPAQGTFTFRLRNLASRITSVTVTSSKKGMATLPVTIR